MKKLPWILFGVVITVIPVAVTIAATTVFNDVSENDWYFDAIQNLQKTGIIEGYNDGSYRPKNNVNRGEMAVMLNRMTDSIRKGCVYEDKILLNGDIVYDQNYDYSQCINGEVVGIQDDPEF